MLRRCGVGVGMSRGGECMDVLDGWSAGVGALESGEEQRGNGCLRERICLATCWGRVKVAWQTGHLWSPAIVVVVVFRSSTFLFRLFFL